jgi:hypothetical protein
MVAAVVLCEVRDDCGDNYECSSCDLEVLHVFGLRVFWKHVVATCTVRLTLRRHDLPVNHLLHDS